ncbi:MAG: site-specific integrase [Bacteroidota bacterium]
MYYYQDGHRVRISEGINEHKTAARRQLAAKKIIQRLKKEHKGRRPLSNTERALNQHLLQNKGAWRQSSYDDYRTIVKNFCLFLNGREVTEKLLRTYLARVKASRHGTTFNKYRSVLRRLLIAIGRPDWFDLIPAVKAEETPARYFQEHQRKQLAAAIAKKDRELWICVQFIYYTFIRPNELRKLKVGDILLDAGEIRVPAEVSKNRKTQYVAIPNVFLDQLSYIKHRKPGSLIFPGKTGKPLGKHTMYRRHMKILEELGYGKGYTLYSWKHTGAVALAKAGISIKQIQIQMRHHSLDQTDSYLRQMGIRDVDDLRSGFPGL